MLQQHPGRQLGFEKDLWLDPRAIYAIEIRDRWDLTALLMQTLCMSDDRQVCPDDGVGGLSLVSAIGVWEQEKRSSGVTKK